MIDLTNVSELIKFINADGQKMLIEKIQTLRREHGAKWKEQIKEDFPLLFWILDLAANHTADDAFKQIKEYVSGQFPKSNILEKNLALGYLETFKPQVFQLHASLRREIDRPQF